jgi:phosphoribosylanthranilate isomerase
MMPRPTSAIKICGLTRADDARHAERAGAAFLGAILAGGPRLLTPERVRDVLGPRRPGLHRVAVFGDQPAAEIVVVAKELALDVVQLHGARTATEAAGIAAEAACNVWPVLRVTGTTLPEDAEALARVSGAIVLDAQVAGQLGGTGVTLDWEGLAASLERLRDRVGGLQVVLAGGLRPENVGRAIRLLSPEVVDVSSGVESAPGVKDPARVEQFVQAVQGAAERSR